MFVHLKEAINSKIEKKPFFKKKHEKLVFNINCRPTGRPPYLDTLDTYPDT
jgi:hypothetical protein